MAEKITKGSGNIFADLGFKNPFEHKAKADLAIMINEIIVNRGLTQKDAAKVIGIYQADVSRLKNGQLSGYTIDRLLSFLTLLGRDIEIKITKRPEVKSKKKTSGETIKGKIIAVAA